MPKNVEPLNNGTKGLPVNWHWATIGDTGDFINGFAFKPLHRSKTGLPIIRIQNLTDDEKPCHLTSLVVPDEYRISHGELLVSWSATLDVFIWQGGEALVNQHIFRVRPNEELIDKRLLFFWLKIAIQQLLETEHLHGSTMKHINRGPFMACKIPLPPKKEQLRIVKKLEEILSDLDTGVAELKNAQKKLEMYRQSLLKGAAEGQLTAAWRAENGCMESGEQLLARILAERRRHWEEKQLSKFREQGKTPSENWQVKYPEPVSPDTTDLPELPVGWVWASLDMLGDIVSGVAKGTKRDSKITVREVPYLRVANVQRGYLNLTEVKTIFATERDIEELALQNGDVLFNEGGDRDKLGRGWVWQGEVENCIHQNHVFRMRPFLTEVIPEFISHHGNTFGKTWFQLAGKQTTNLASINMTVLRAFPVPLAPAAEQREVLKVLREGLTALDQQKKSVEQGLKRSEAQQKNIIKTAYSGQLVPQDPNDEPASVLLERIKTERAERSKQPKLRIKKQIMKEAVTSMKKLFDVLAEAADWLPTKDAFQHCGVVDGTQTSHVEEVYAELRAIDKANLLEVRGTGQFQELKLKAKA